MNKSQRILAVDDEPSMRRLLQISLRQAGYQPILAENGRQAMELLRERGADMVVSDLHMPGMGGLQLLQAMRDEGLDIPVIIITAQGEIKTAVEAMKLGASDYLLRPFDLETLEIAINRAFSVSRLKIENQFLRSEAERSTPQLIGNSPAMQKVQQAIAQVGPEKATVLITGETGTGKELVAHAIHQHSPRNAALFVAVNCAAIPGEMLESELFGHERGAFTGAVKERIGKFELADGGTLFLDEITEMPVHLQAKLLRALQENVIERLGGNRPITVDIRVVAATNMDPLQAIKDGKLREDLYYRLNVFRIDLPALRNRTGDIPLLCKYFLHKRNADISNEALTILQVYTWPGNIRELANVLERAGIVSGGQTISASHLPADIAGSVFTRDGHDEYPLAEPHTGEQSNLSLPPAIEALEKELIRKALVESGDNKSKAARLLGISERSLWYKLSRYKI